MLATDPVESALLAASLAAELRTLIGRLHRRMREQGHLGDFTISQISAILRLEESGPLTVSALARIEGMRSQSMGAIVSSLEAANFVSGAADPADGRQTLWSITPACREQLRAGRVAREDWLFRTVQSKLSPDEQAQLANAVELLKRLANGDRESR
jgi:DNA-binding MarR family transcriptional regulator